jgi:hypothetical protein
MAKGKFGALAEFRNQDSAPQGREAAPERILPPPPSERPSERRRGRPTGKRSNPDYEQVTVLVRKQTRKAAVRLLEDTAADQDFSELIEDLLSRWISKSA